MSEEYIRDDDYHSVPVGDATLKGTIKAVVSGSTLVLGSTTGKNTKTLTLQSLIAPRPAIRSGEEDEPWAWEAREFLRKKVVGKNVTLRITHKVDGQDFGHVFLGNENLALVTVEAGWARVSPEAPRSEYYNALTKAEDTAKGEKKGLWADEKDTSQVRKINFSPDKEAVIKANKGKTVDATCEQVVSGSVMRVNVVRSSPLDQEQWLVSLAGVSSPGFKKGSQGVLVPYPWAPEAKAVTERILLGRNVKVTVVGTDKKRGLIAATIVPASNSNTDVRLDLVKEGLARTTSDLESSDKNAKALKDSQKEAKSHSAGVWGKDPANAGPASTGTTVTGTPKSPKSDSSGGSGGSQRGKSGGKTKGLKGAPRPGSKASPKGVGNLASKFEAAAAALAGDAAPATPDPPSGSTSSSTPAASDANLPAPPANPSGSGGGGSKRAAPGAKRGSTSAKGRGSTSSRGNRKKSPKRGGSATRKRSPSGGSKGKRGGSGSNRSKGDRNKTGNKGPPVTDAFLKAFSDKSAWTRCTAVAILQPPDLANPTVLSKVLSLLGDTDSFSIPSRAPNADEQLLLRILRIGTLKYTRWLQVTPADKRPNPDREGEQRYWVSDVVSKVLQLMPVFPVSDDSLETIVASCRNNDDAPFLIRKWVDKNLPKFDWPDIGAAFNGFVKQILSQPVVEPPHIDFVLRGLADHQYGYVATQAANRDPPSWSTLHNVYRRDMRGDTGAVAVMNALEKTSQKLGVEALPILSRIALKSQNRKRAHALITKVESNGVKEATGYLAIHEKSAADRFKKMCKDMPEASMKAIILRARDAKFPKEFPLPDALSVGDRDWCMRGLLSWDEIPEERKIKTLKKLVDTSPTPRQSYEPLFELAKFGVLTTDKKYAAKFFEALKDAVQATDDWQLVLESWNFEDNPIVMFSTPNTRPAGFEAAVLGLMKDGAVDASVVCHALKPNKWRSWEPDAAAKPIVLEAAKAEVEKTQKAYDASTKSKILKHPSESAIWNLHERWAPLKAVITTISPGDELLTRINKLIALPQPKVPYGDWY